MLWAGSQADLPTLRAMNHAVAARYHLFARVLHVLLALALTGMFVVGLYMADLPFSPLRLKLYNWHKWAGMVVLAFSLLRLLWRFASPPPELPPAVRGAMPLWQLRAHGVTLLGLYLLFFVVPLLGWAYSSASGFPIVVFGLWPLPDWVPVNETLADVLKPVHRYAAYALAALVLVHVGAAFKHQFVDRDGLLSRMGFGRARS